MFWELIKLMVSLFLVLLAAVYVIKYGIAKFNPYQRKRGSQILVLERVPVAPRSWVCLVKVGQEMLLLGISSNQVNLLCHLDSENLLEMEEQEGGQSFSLYMDKFKKDYSDQEGNNLFSKLATKLKGTNKEDKDED